MKKVLYFIITTIFCCGIGYGQNALLRERDPYADSTAYKAIYLQSPSIFAPAKLSNVGGHFNVNISNANGTGSASNIIFVGMDSPALQMKQTDTSLSFYLKFPSLYGLSVGNTAYFAPRDGIIVVHNTLTKSANYTATISDDIILMSAAGGQDTLTLPSGDSFPNVGGAVSGGTFTIKKTDATANVVVVKAAAGQTIDGAASDSLRTQYKYVTVVSNGGAAWYIIANN